MTFEDDRAYLELAIRKLEGNAGPIATLLESSRERQFFEMSLRNQRIYQKYVEKKLSCSIQKDILLNELEDFLSQNDSMRNLPKVCELRAELEGSKDGD